ncbi:MAG TPA: hypothetical protein VEH06_08065 [Candidatus Bathyarchaeia archaeon]|nr:hypothetical protein [Candidatus Bathyarchaeia archaeon]
MLYQTDDDSITKPAQTDDDSITKQQDMIVSFVEGPLHNMTYVYIR